MDENVRHRNIPAELKNLSQWVLWRAETRDGKQTKVPYAQGGRKASVADPSTWATFNSVIQTYTGGGFSGVGFVLTSGDPYVAWDLDYCIKEDGSIAQWALDVINKLQSYTEITPSGRGMRVICKAKLALDKGNRATMPEGGRLEVYSSKRYITVTGNIHSRYTTIEHRQSECEELYCELFDKAQPAAPTHALVPSSPDSPDKIHLLIEGRWEEAGYKNQSDADMALCSYLARAFRDPAKIDAMFRNTGMYRPKWDERHSASGLTYGEMTIAKALRGQIAKTPGISVVKACEVQPKPAEWLIDGFLAKGALAVFCGRPKMGKTTILVHLIACLATGAEFAGRATQKTNVLALMFEDYPDDIVSEIALHVSGGVPDGIFLPKIDSITPDQLDWSAVFSTAAENNCGLVVVDPLVSVSKLDARNATEYEKVYSRLTPVISHIRSTGITVIAVTHTAKGKAIISDIGDVIDAPIDSTAYSASPDLIAAWGLSPHNKELRRLLATGRRKAGIDVTWEWDGAKYVVTTKETPPIMSVTAKRVLEYMRSCPPDTLHTLKSLRRALKRNADSVQAALYELLNLNLVEHVHVNGKICWRLV